MTTDPSAAPEPEAEAAPEPPARSPSPTRSPSGVVGVPPASEASGGGSPPGRRESDGGGRSLADDTGLLGTNGADSPAIAQRLDRMAAQVDAMAAELEAQRRAREQWVELADTMVPVTRGAMDLATRELQDLSVDVTADDAARFARTLARTLPQLEVLLAQLSSLAELMHEVNSLSGAGMQRLTEVLQVADDKGYFAFAQQTGRIADRVVTEYTEDDVAALGDNVVTILNAVKEMTQPEVMGLVRRTALTVQDVEDTHIEPPSMFALLKSMRDAQTRRGLARVLTMLHTVGEEAPPPPQAPAERK